MKEKLEKLFDEMATTGLNPTPKIDKEEFVLLATRLLQDELSSIANRWPGQPWNKLSQRRSEEHYRFNSRIHRHTIARLTLGNYCAV
jgi:hypothetical protein